MEDRMTAQQLKNSILQMAVQGKLVPQDPNDEPASVLLERIRKEKEQLIKDGKIKKNKKESYIFRGADNLHYEQIDDETKCIEDELPFEIPDNWEWIRLGTLTYNHGQKKPKSNFCYIDIGSIDNEHQKLNSSDTIMSFDEAPSRARKIVKLGDILYSTVRPYLHNMCIINREFNLEPIASTGFAVLTCHSNYNNIFLFMYMMSPDFDKYVNSNENSKGVAYPAINDSKLSMALIPVPPLKEQMKIVEKIKKLEPLIENYKQTEEKLYELNSNIKEQLKKSILQYAIEGKLVSQNSNDEPASVLLEKIHEEKEKLIAEGKIKRDKNESIIYRRDNSYYEKLDNKEKCINDNIPFDLPINWTWCKLVDLFTNFSGLSYKKNLLSIKSDNMVRILRGGNISNGKYELKTDDLFISKEFVKDELLLKKGELITPSVTSFEHIGKTALIDKELSNVVAGGFVLVLKPISNIETLLKYILYFTGSEYYKASCKTITHKSGQAFYNLSRDKLMNNILIPIPALKEQKRIVETIEKILEFIK